MVRPAAVDDDAIGSAMRVDSDVSLGHHLFQIAQTQTIGQTPTDAEQVHRSIRLPAFEHLIPSEFHRRSLPDDSAPKSLRQSQ
jgi:hypothetical protein